MTSKKYKAVFFDFDGTIIEFPKKFLFSQAETVFKELGLPMFTPEGIEEAFSSFDFFSICPEERREEFMEVYWDKFNWKDYPDGDLVEGIVEALKDLHARGLRLAVVTSRNEDLNALQDRLVRLGLDSLFETVVGRTEEGEDWSDKSPQIKIACERLGVEPSSVVLVGDVPPDIESANRSGLGLSVGVLTGGIKESVLMAANPGLVLKRASLLPEAI